ncbi:unnamed protein product [Nezara viridula]|uniref:Uncharacterized protein n=1 Tax=Nezara viridula TaxID=85310 RepID=A0A9P0E8T2_NEZVI|nr:unnamed protein product [Nezara viridula]
MQVGTLGAVLHLLGRRVPNFNKVDMYKEELDKFYGGQLTVLQLNGLRWISRYTRHQDSLTPLQREKNIASRCGIQNSATTAAVLKALLKEDYDALFKIHRLVNLDYFNYPRMASYLKDDHIF